MKWQDAKTHRDPTWPVGMYAPGGYMGTCRNCNGDFLNMDKRAFYCFPCAVEALIESEANARAELHRVREQLDTLKSAFSIVAPLPSEKEEAKP